MKKLINSATIPHLVRGAFSLAFIFIAIQLMIPFAMGQRRNAPDQSASPAQACSWSAGATMPTVLVRAVGVYFSANSRLYAMGGRISDSAGSDQQNPREYNPATNTWATRAEVTPDNQMNNMACGVLTDAGTPWIYCVGGSAAGQTVATARVFRFNPVTGAMQALPASANWPGDADGITLPGGFAVFNNKLYLFGGFQINTSMKTGIWEFTPTANTWVTKAAVLPSGLGYIPTATIGSFIYLAGGSLWDGTTLQDTNSSLRYDPSTDTIITRAVPPRVVAETRSLNFGGAAYVLGGGRTPPNPNNEVDVYTPGTDTWAVGVPFVTQRRNFPTDTDGTKIYLAGGYASDGLTPLDSMEIFSCPSATLSGAVSRKTHTGVGAFDIALPAGTECRSGGGTNDFTIVATFTGPVTVNGNPQAQVVAGTGCVGSAGVCSNGAVSISGNDVTIPLTNIADDQTITVRLNAVNGGGNVDIQMTRSLGDTNGTGTVSSADIAQTKSRIGQAVTATTFRSDVNTTGSINATDVTIIKNNL